MYVVGPNNRQITTEEFDKLTKHGCANCSCNISVEDAKWVDWINNQPICKGCAEELSKGE